MMNFVTIHLTRADLNAMVQPSSAMPVVKLSSSSAFIFAMGAVIGGGCGTLVESALGTPAVLAWPLGGLFGAFVAVWLWLRRIEAAVPLRKFPDMPMLITLSDDGIAATHASFASRDGWDNIAEIKPLPEHLVIVTAFDTHYVLPARNFADRQHFEAFVAEAQRLFKAHALLKADGAASNSSVA